MRTKVGMVQWMAKGSSDVQDFKRLETSIQWEERVSWHTTLLPGHYRYFFDRSTMEGDSSLQGMHLSVGAGGIASDSWFLDGICFPPCLKQWLATLLAGSAANHLLLGWLTQPGERCDRGPQDKLIQPKQHPVETTPVIAALQRAIVQQSDQYMQKSRQLGQHSGLQTRTSALVQRVIKSSEHRICVSNGNLTAMPILLAEAPVVFAV